jgi:hypothetical protein
MGLLLSNIVSKLGKLFIKLHNNMSTCEVQVLAHNILDIGHRNLGFEPGTSDRFFRYFFGLKKCGDKAMA